MVIATPIEREHTTIVDGRTVTGRPLTLFIERWTTDLLGCRTWRVTARSTRQALDGTPVVTTGLVGWFAVPDTASAAALRRFTTAGYGQAPCTVAQLCTRRLIGPAPLTIATEIRAPQ